MRCFFALNLPAVLRSELLDAGRTLRGLCGQEMRLIPEDNLHLTLKFIEHLPPSDVEALCREAGRHLSACEPFEIGVRGYGAFPSAGRARVFWAGVDDPDKQLEHLASLLDKAAGELALPREQRRFTPHITLARLKRPTALPLEVLMAQLPKRGVYPLTVTAITLYESRTDPEGAVYTPVADFPLGG